MRAVALENCALIVRAIAAVIANRANCVVVI